MLLILVICLEAEEMKRHHTTGNMRGPFMFPVRVRSVRKPCPAEARVTWCLWSSTWEGKESWCYVRPVPKPHTHWLKWDYFYFVHQRAYGRHQSDSVYGCCEILTSQLWLLSPSHFHGAMKASVFEACQEYKNVISFALSRPLYSPHF